MTIQDDKERFTFVIDKNIKAKLQILADMNNRKLGNFIANILYEYIQNYEGELFEQSKVDRSFIKQFQTIFGRDLKPEQINSKGFVFFDDEN